jgi:SAM-dependent methyltransferase
VGAGAGTCDDGPVDDRYTHGHQEAVLRSHRWRTAENSAAHLLPHLGPGQRLLDVGCGPGTLTLDLAERVAPGPVLGLDASAPVVAEAARRADEHPAGAGVTFSVGDVHHLAAPDGSFDVVHAHQVLQHLSEPVEALREMRRVLAPGGVLALRESDYGAFAWAPDDPVLDRWMELYHQVTRVNRADADAGRHLPGWAARAGIERLAVTSSTWTFATPEDRAWWGGLWAERTEASGFAEQALEYGLTDHQELHRIARGFRRWAAADDGIFVVTHVEVVGRA